jgi:hypothetical protein
MSDQKPRGSFWMFSKSGSIVEVVGRSTSFPEAMIVKRVDTGKQMLVSEESLVPAPKED